MNYLLRIECINETTGGMKNKNRELLAALIKGVEQGQKFAPRRYWVAEITGRRKKALLVPRKDWSKSNDIGTRGVYAFYILKPDKIYEVSSPTSWNDAEKYFCRIEGANLIKMTREEVDAWLNGTLTPTCLQPQENA